MAHVESLGISTPSAISYLVSEGILPPDPDPSLYTQKTYALGESCDNQGFEELLYTRTCVAWSRSGVLRKLYTFDVEEESINHVAFARFRDDDPRVRPRSKVSRGFENNTDGIGRDSLLNTSEQRSSQSERPNGAAAPGQQLPTGLASKESDSNRALVVFLKSQAHIYFLTGTHYLVHLPFEVASVFPLATGLLLQRNLIRIDGSGNSPQLPPAPPASFAFSQWSSFGPPQHSFGHKSQETQDELPPAVKSMLDSWFEEKQESNNPSSLPAHFLLRDPIAEFGKVVERSSRTSKRASKPAKPLDPHERIIYVSEDELSPYNKQSKDNDRHATTMIAVSVNRINGQFSIWTISDVKKLPRSSNHRISTATSGAVSRRRSSFGPGTGATTPAARTSMGPRESFGQFREDEMLQDDIGLASQLDPSFETPGAPLKSSRRISSLLARSELSGNRDISSLADLTSGHNRSTGVRRGPSFGGPGARRSFGPQGVQEKSRRNVSSSYSNTEAMDLGIDEDDSSSDSGSDEGPPAWLNPASTILSSLQHELVFTKIYSFGGASFSNKSQTSKQEPAASINVFQLDPPKHTNSLGDGLQPVLCIMEHGSQQFFIVRLRANTLPSKKSDRDSAAKLEVKVLEVTKGQGIIDACKITDGSSNRALVLSSTDDGSNSLSLISLQSPWGVQSMLQAPKKFLIYHPFQVDLTQNQRRKREGGFKRVLSEGPDEIVGLRQCPARGQFELCDSSSVRHRLQLRLRPQNTLVLRIFQACEFVLNTTDREREPLQRLWWDVMSFLSQRHVQGDIEWQAFLVSIFSMFVGYLDHSANTNSVRTKRKSGLLRSSSGANTDLEDFNEMLKSERSARRPYPDWMQQSCWEWIIEQPTEDQSARTPSPQARTKRSLGSSQTEDRTVFNKKVALDNEYVDLAKEFVQSKAGIQATGKEGYLPTALSVEPQQRDYAMPIILVALHLLREELKLDILAGEQLHALTPVLAQIGGWLGWEDWGWKSSSFYMLESAEMEMIIFNDASLNFATEIKQPLPPPSILEFVEAWMNGNRGNTYPTLVDVASSKRSEEAIAFVHTELTPRTTFILKFLHAPDETPSAVLKLMEDCGIDLSILETLPEGIAAPLRSAIASCQVDPSGALSSNILDLIDRNDISMLDLRENIVKSQFRGSELTMHESTRDYHTICSSTLETEQVGAYDGSAEMDRQAITRMIFKEDQRFAEASKLLHPLKRAVARCDQEIGWTETDLLEAQHEVAKVVAIRTLSVSPGRAMIFFSARYPLLTEKFPIHGFSLACIMKPTNTIVTADKNIYTEEKVAWAFFHAGVEAGLSISKDAKGIDTSWILFNKPPELNNRHAGFLLALGLNGHLKNIAKWVAFKYLTPKHTMTSIGLLLGLAASYLGTMDTLITRLLSVHVTRMLPPGAAELNLSPLTQTTGIMAIGLLYCNTQHRRMSEIMLSEMENIELDDTNNPLENLRDEGYRLAAGFALGFINLGQGKKMSGLRDMRIVERLLALAVATKMVDIVHILDKATAAATIAIALVYMKTGDEALSRKIDIPDTTHQFVYVRPDIFLLRTVARHLIMWDGITPSFSWIRDSLPPSLKEQAKLGQYRYLSSEQLALFNIIAGLCLSLGLRFAGTARQDVRDLLGHYLDCFMEITKTPGTSYDEKLTRITARNCQDVVALAAASVMAGTGDIYLFRRFRILHNRTDPDTPYGSHLAAHQAIGVLFLGGGTHTFGTSNLAVASLLCAFYPLFPTGVLDNKSHLQAFRHFWVLASEPRTLVVRSVEARRPIVMQIVICLKTGEELEARAPCLLPPLDTIARIESSDAQYWPVTLDFVNNPSHQAAFARHQSMFVRRRGAYNASATVFGTTIRALNDAAMVHQLSKHSFEWIFSLASFASFDRAERALVLPTDSASLMHNATRSTAVDSRLALERLSLESSGSEKLRDLRILFAWANKMTREKKELNWLGKEVLDGLRARVQLMGRESEEEGDTAA